MAGIMTNPTWAWVTQVARNVTAELWDAGIDVTSFLRDPDAKFAFAFDAVLQGERAPIRRSPVRAPDAGCERSDQCTDRLFIVNERHL